jgi:hypothetical protein
MPQLGVLRTLGGCFLASTRIRPKHWETVGELTLGVVCVRSDQLIAISISLLVTLWMRSVGHDLITNAHYTFAIPIVPEIAAVVVEENITPSCDESILQIWVLRNLSSLSAIHDFCFNMFPILAVRRVALLTHLMNLFPVFESTDALTWDGVLERQHDFLVLVLEGLEELLRGVPLGAIERERPNEEIVGALRSV